MASPTREAADKAEAPGRVLYVDDQPELRRLFRRHLTRLGHMVVEAAHAQLAIELVQQLSFDVVVSDVRMPEMSGFELLRAIGELDPDLPVVLTSGSPDTLALLQANELGAYAYLVKPVSFETMRETVIAAIESRRARLHAREAFEPYHSVERMKVPPPDDD